jgi:hypothetical protein
MILDGVCRARSVGLGSGKDASRLNATVPADVVQNSDTDQQKRLQFILFSEYGVTSNVP